jgi:NADH:ubiquinone oxidoreductase subunit 5 (subunit L)/multisubunit Na+/H+ antiporter MnhA subunit
MTLPLIVLSIFAMGLGWVGVAEDFPAIGGLLPDWIHHFVMSTVEPFEPIEHPAIAPEEVLRVELIPLVVGVILEVGGLSLGWFVYARRPMQVGEPDREWTAMRRISLGPLYWALRRGFRIDELYHAAFARTSILLADLCHAFDHEVIDKMVSLTGVAARELSRGSAAFDLRAVDRLANTVADLVREAGRPIRASQTGRVQSYLLGMSFAVVALVVLLSVVLFAGI